MFSLGAVTLSVTVGDYPQQIIKDVTFLMVDCFFAYNAILGRPTLNSWKAVTSTYHLMIKFPTDYKVGELRGNRVAAQECYIAMLEADFIREVYYLDCLANVVMVKKANGKWRMCVDFTSLNEVCPKDNYLLPILW